MARRLLMAAGAVALVAALGGGLVRLGWSLPGPFAGWAARHGPLLVSGFLGALIGLERAVGLGRRWAYGAPVLAAFGSLALLAGGLLPVGAAGRSGAGAFPAGLLVRAAPWLFLASGLVLTGAFGAIYRIRASLPVLVMGTGALAWSVGNGVSAAGEPLARAVPWWAGFLVLTIAGERMELAHIRGRPGGAVAGVGVLAAGMALSLGPLQLGVAVAGAGMLILSLWLLRRDLAWRTVRQPGLTRYIAVCLLAGHAWLGAGGLMWLGWASRFGAGPWYDAMLHAVFVGFVMSMIFGHAPVIFPAVLGGSVRFGRGFYVPLALLHASLALRVAGDVAASPLRAWGGLLNVAAIVLFLVQMAASVRHGAPGAAPVETAQTAARATRRVGGPERTGPAPLRRPDAGP